MTNEDRLQLPKIQLLVLFLSSCFFILPCVFKLNVLASCTFAFVIFSYLLSEIDWLRRYFDMSNKQLALNIILIAISGLLAFEVFFMFALVAIYPVSKFYKT